MASEFTPTMENLISAYAWAAADDDAEHRAADARRAIDAHDREVAARALREAANECREAFLMRSTAPTSWTTRAADAIEEVLRARAYRIERGES